MVQKFIIRLAFFISVSVLLLHNLTPHMHHSELSDEEHSLQHEEASSWFDWLMLGFHDDLGGGHLECFSHLEKIQLSPKVDCVIPLNFLLSDPFYLELLHQPVNDAVRKNPCILLLVREQICHESHLSNRPPPVA